MSWTDCDRAVSTRSWTQGLGGSSSHPFFELKLLIASFWLLQAVLTGESASRSCCSSIRFCRATLNFLRATGCAVSGEPPGPVLLGWRRMRSHWCPSPASTMLSPVHHRWSSRFFSYWQHRIETAREAFRNFSTCLCLYAFDSTFKRPFKCTF